MMSDKDGVWTKLSDHLQVLSCMIANEVGDKGEAYGYLFETLEEAIARRDELDENIYHCYIGEDRYNKEGNYFLRVHRLNRSDEWKV